MDLALRQKTGINLYITSRRVRNRGSYCLSQCRTESWRVLFQMGRSVLSFVIDADIPCTWEIRRQTPLANRTMFRTSSFRWFWTAGP